jgi:hypothetical protein
MRQPLDLNMASRPFRNNTWIWIGLLLGIGLVVQASWWNYSTWSAESRRLDELRQSVRSIDSQVVELGRREVSAKMGAKNHDLDLLDSQAIKANDVIMLKAFSWTRLFNRLEKLQPYDVRMQAIRPVFNLGKKGGNRERTTTASSDDLEAHSVMVTVEGTAKNLDAFLELETALLKDPWFDRIEPERYSRLSRQETQFTLKFHYYPNKQPIESPPQNDEADSSSPVEGTEGELAAQEATK